MGIATNVARVVMYSTVVAVLAACTTSHEAPLATISGRLLAVGGPAPGAARPLPGTVKLENVATHAATVVRVGDNGRYSASVAAGTYEIHGRSPLYGDGRYDCVAPKPLPVTADKRTEADVYCEEV